MGYHPIVVTVKPEFYEETLDYDIEKTVSKDIEVHKVDARPVRKPRIIGDIGIRGFRSMKKRALEIIAERKIDFIWIPIPSFYSSLLGPAIHKKTGVPYGIDYIDPWVRDATHLPGLRVKLSIAIAKVLEPIAVRRASLISGVSRPYYEPVLERNFKNKSIADVAMPYGFDPNDHKIELEGLKMPWSDQEGIKPIIYAGAFLPNSSNFMDLLFKALKDLRQEGKLDPSIRLYFIGTGSYKHESISTKAEKNAISDIVIEDRSRHPFLNILQFLSHANGLMIIGSTEMHYTASKTFQSLLSERPVFAVFHHLSSAVTMMKDTNASEYLVEYVDRENNQTLFEKMKTTWLKFQEQRTEWNPDLTLLTPYSSKESARKLAKKLDEILDHEM